jgi:hypothetical protein
MALPIWSFVRVQAPNGTLLGVLSAAVFFLLSHDLPTGPLVAWTVGVGVLVSCAATLAGAVVLRRSVVVRDDAPGKAREDPRDHACTPRWTGGREVFCEVEKEGAPDGAEEQEQVTPERQAICDRLNAAIAEHQTAEEHTANLRREVENIENELAAYDKAARAARFKAAVQGAA